MAKKIIEQIDRIPVALLITDTHLHKNNGDLVIDIFKQAIELCLKLNIKYIKHLGDFFTSREAQPKHVLIQAYEIFAMITNAGLHLDIMPGNHDKTDLEANDSYLTIFHEYIDHLIDEPINCFWHVNDSLFNDLNIIWIPYYKERGSYLQKLNDATEFINKNKKNILLTHISINGVQNNDGSSQENEIKQELFKAYHKVFVGHFHNQQQTKNIYYIGSSYQANYGEDNIKGFTILYNNGDHEFVKSKFPEYTKIKIKVEDMTNAKIKELSKQKDNVRVVLVGESTKLKAFNKENLLDLGIDVKFESDEINTNTDISNNELIVFDRNNIQNAFDKFIEINSIEDKEFGLTYLKEAI